MERDLSKIATRVDSNAWERRELFAFFDSFSEPFHGICVRVDCTETFRYAKNHHLSVFLTMVHRSLVAAHQVENFMTRSVEGGIWRFQTIHGASAIRRPNGTIGFGHHIFHHDLHEFVREASLEVARVKASDDLTRNPAQDVVRFSVLPWFDFTSISHARDLSRKDSAPRITFGKITDTNARCTMPVSIHVHHGLVDGEHLALFIEQFQDRLTRPESKWVRASGSDV